MAVVVPGPNEDGRDAADPAAPAAGTPHPSSLEYLQNVVGSDDPDGDLYEVAKAGCDSWFCPDCCVRKGYNRRAELIPILEKFRAIMMLTLTIDPELFPSPRDAYLHVGEKRGVSELMRHLGRGGYLHSPRYIYVTELQKDTEQVHYHVLVDATYIPKEEIDRGWDRLRPKEAPPRKPGRPGFGICRFSRRRFEGGAVHAARYATKYLVKTPDDGWPSWVLNMGKSKRFHRYGTSRGFWGHKPTKSVPTGKTREPNPRTYAERLTDCGQALNVFEVLENVDFQTGEVVMQRHWRARVLADADCLAMIEPGQDGLPRRVSVRAHTPKDVLKVIQEAAGHPVMVVAGSASRKARPA